MDMDALRIARWWWNKMCMERGYGRQRCGVACWRGENKKNTNAHLVHPRMLATTNIESTLRLSRPSSTHPAFYQSSSRALRNRCRICPCCLRQLELDDPDLAPLQLLVISAGECFSVPCTRSRTQLSAPELCTKQVA